MFTKTEEFTLTTLCLLSTRGGMKGSDLREAVIHHHVVSGGGSRAGHELRSSFHLRMGWLENEGCVTRKERLNEFLTYNPEAMPLTYFDMRRTHFSMTPHGRRRLSGLKAQDTSLTPFPE